MASKRQHSVRTLHAAIALALTQGAVVAAAQEQAPEAGIKLAQATQAQAKDAKKDSPTAVEQIVVTARRREELLQDVPGAVSAFSAAAIEAAGIPDLTGIANLVPARR